MIQKILKTGLLALLLFGIFTTPVSFSQELDLNQYYQAEVVNIVSENNTENSFLQTVEVELTEGPESGENKIVIYERVNSYNDNEKLVEGERVVLIRIRTGENFEYFIHDKYRLNAVYLLIFLTIVITILIAGMKGISAMVGLSISILILVRVVIPGIERGINPILISIVGAGLIVLTSMYIAHGFNRRTTISLFSTLITISITILIAIWSVDITKLFGLGSDEAFYLQAVQSGGIDLRGLLLAGIVIGTLDIFISDNFKDIVKKQMCNFELVLEETGLSAITLKYDYKFRNYPGMASQVLNLLAINSIIFVECLTTYSEFIIYIKQEYTDKTINLLRKTFMSNYTNSHVKFDKTFM